MLFMGKFTISMVIFHSYVKLPEGKLAIELQILSASFYEIIYVCFSPTCQVRVVRFYQSACPPLPPPPPPPPSPPPRLAVLLALLLASASSTSTSALPSSVCTAGPQPASCPAQCAPLDLNRGPAQLSVHRWTSTAR